MEYLAQIEALQKQVALLSQENQDLLESISAKSKTEGKDDAQVLSKLQL